MAMPTDRDAIAAAILTCGRADLDNARLVRMPDTLDLEHLLVSESLREEVEADAGLEVLAPAAPMSFDSDGQIEKWR